jgi:hypothetical protein
MMRRTCAASCQKRGVFGIIKRELRRRSAIEPVIGHMKAEGHLGRCYLKGRAGDAANAILSAVGYNFRRILAWLRALLCFFLIAIHRLFIIRSALNPGPDLFPLSRTGGTSLIDQDPTGRTVASVSF